MADGPRESRVTRRRFGAAGSVQSLQWKTPRCEGESGLAMQAVQMESVKHAWESQATVLSISLSALLSAFIVRR